MFAIRMQKYLGKPFQEGAIGPDAYDCVGFIYRFVKDAGKDIPDSFQDFNTENYSTLTKGNKESEIEYLRAWLLTLGKEISVGQKLAGDLILVDAGAGIFVALYGGNNHAVSVFQKDGVRTFALGKHIQPIMAVRLD